jgi:hypothetical protein
MMQNPFDDNQTSVRPTLLTFLCILTLVWNAYKFYGAIPNTFTPDKVVENKEQSNEIMTEMLSKYMKEDDLAAMEKTQAETNKMFEKDKLVLAGGISLISSLLLILGAIWMWGLRKDGFFVYIAGNIVGILAPIIIFGGQIGWSIGIMSFIASAIFTGLYAINLKNLV